MKKWTVQEDFRLQQFHKNLKEGEVVKDHFFKILADELGRTQESVSRRYYTLYPTPNNTNADRQDFREIDRYKLGQLPRFLWTDEKLNVLKQELNKAIGTQISINQMIENLSTKLGIATSTVFKKIKELQSTLKVDNLENLYNLVVAGVSLEEINKKPPRKKMLIRKDNQSVNHVVKKRDVRRRWTQKEEMLLKHLVDSFQEGDSREGLLREFAKKIGRPEQSVFKKYYTEYRAGVKGGKVNPKKQIQPITIQQVTIQPENTDVKRIGRTPKITWNQEELIALKEELEVMISKQYSNDRLYIKFASRVDISKTTSERKINELKVKLNAKNMLELYNKIKSMNLSNIVEEEKMEEETTNNIVIETEEVKKAPANPQVVEKVSIWQKLNPFYRIRQLEKQIEDLKRNKE